MYCFCSLRCWNKITLKRNLQQKKLKKKTKTGRNCDDMQLAEDKEELA